RRPRPTPARARPPPVHVGRLRLDVALPPHDRSLDRCRAARAVHGTRAHIVGAPPRREATAPRLHHRHTSRARNACPYAAGTLRGTSLASHGFVTGGGSGTWLIVCGASFARVE